ncbi:sarcolemmal membrane-associated protein-like isoform X3 [Physella acuta]|uniref:sarcolemmal membrane-associated protein-like isoform X3 n=1 Tax=Physella acuta TaxID=109671 RepID=UPI0027DD8C7B|nr:sarcolemmal membrane-associated protein-like isoform X3 [Physella acuta]
MVEGEEKIRPTMSALAILSCRPNSHPFQERQISLHEAVKIGRSVARARPSANNGIFDCKVLSRHHAMLWYETGKFYLQDTKSSNGTFINNQRLCKGGEESPAREVFSGDLIQFGVEVMENNRRGEKITHGCIIGTITLYHPDGREAKPAPYLSGENQPGISLQTQDLYQLAQYLQEALHREKMLEQKLLTLRQLVHNTQEASESGWQALIDEDKLLSRLEMLENQLHIYSKNHSEDTLRQELQALQEDKNKYETTSKESLRRVLQEKLEAVTKLSDLEQSLGNMKEECTHLKSMCESSHGELSLLAEKYQEQLKEISELQEKLQEAEQSHASELEKSRLEKAELSQKLEEMVQQETSLSAKIESLTADNDFTKEQLASMKAKLESIKEFNEDDQKLTENNGSSTEVIHIIPLAPPKEDDVPENLEVKLKDLQKLIETYKSKIETSDTKLVESNNRIEQLQKDLEVAVSNSKEYLIKISHLEDKVKLSDFHMNEMVENALHNLKLQLKESAKQSNSSNDWIEAMKDHIHLMEKELTLHTPVNSVVNSTESLDEMTSQADSSILSSPPPPSSRASLSNTTLVGSPPDLLHDTVVNGSKEDGQEQDADTTVMEVVKAPSNNGLTNLDDDEDLKALLEEARQAQEKAVIELRKYKAEASDSELKLKKSSDEVFSLRTQLVDAQQQAKEKSDLVKDLQEQVKKAESFTQDVKQQILDLREQLDNERSKTKSLEKELEEAKMQLATSQQNAKQNHNETEHLKDKLKHLQEELDCEKNRRDSPRHGGLTAKSKEYQALKEECANLRKRIQAIEAEMKMSRKENLHLSSEYNKLQESYKHLESLKLKLETSEVSWKCNLTDAQKDAHNVRQEVRAVSSTTSTASTSTRSSSDLDSGLPLSPPSSNLSLLSPGQISSKETMIASSSLSDHTQVSDVSSFHQGEAGPFSSSMASSGSLMRGPLGPPSPSVSSSLLSSQLEDARQELIQLRSACEEKSTLIGSLQKQITDMTSEYQALQNQARRISLGSSIPLLMLLFAILMIIYPTLEAITSSLS